MSRGHFIVLEGLEGAGKSTAVNTVQRFLHPQVPELIVVREPGGTAVGEIIRKLIKDDQLSEPLDARAELLLFYAARIQLLQCVVLPALQRGAWVLADRFELSTFAYQGGGRQLDPSFIQALSRFSLQDFKPDLTLFLDIKPELGLSRALMRGKKDRIEQETEQFFYRVYHAYQTHIRAMDNIVVVDASQPLNLVQRLIKTSLQAFMTKVHCHHAE